MPRTVTALVLTFAATAIAVQRPSIAPEWTARIKPFQVMGNIYYVGTQDLSSFLITGPDGDVIIDLSVDATTTTSNSSS